MQLRTNGPVVSAYRWLYGISRYNLGQNFCPIFWMMALGAVLIIPYTLFCLPVVLAEIFDKNYENGDRSFGERIGISIFVYAWIFCLFAVGQFVGFLLGYYHFNEGAVPGGALIVFTSIVIAAVYYIRKYIDYRRDKANAKRWEKTSNGEIVPDTIVEVIANTWSAFYDKYCPRITWIDPKEKPYTGAMDEEEDTPVDNMELAVHVDPVLGTTYGLKNINNTESETLDFPNLKP